MSPLTANLIAARLRYRSLFSLEDADLLIETARSFEREAELSRQQNRDVCFIAVPGDLEEMGVCHGLAV